MRRYLYIERSAQIIKGLSQIQFPAQCPLCGAEAVTLRQAGHVPAHLKYAKYQCGGSYYYLSERGGYDIYTGRCERRYRERQTRQSKTA